MGKLWKFYKKDTNSSSLSVQDKCPLYAFTNSKKLLLAFISNRDIKANFYFITDDDISKEDYVLFANKNKSCMLDDYVYKTCILTDNNKYKLHDVQVVSTYSEYYYVQDAVEDGIFAGDIIDLSMFINTDIFKNKYKKSLDLIKYTESSTFIRGIAPTEVDVYSDPTLIYDELQIFIDNFGYLFK